MFSAIAKKKRKPGQSSGRRGYEAAKETARRISAEKSLSGRDIGPLPEVVNPERKARCAESFELYCREYFPARFYLPWSPDHREAIEYIEAAARLSDLFAYAMMRGGGKTTLVITAMEWASSYGYQEFSFVVAATDPKATAIIGTVKKDFESNPLLFEDFPEICYPVRKLDGIAQRANGQLFEGKRTGIVWKDNEIVLPTIPGSKASSAIIKGDGITGSGTRGPQHSRSDGRLVRPGFVMIDDPQTNESAKSPAQIAERESIICGAIMGMVGPGHKLGAVMPCTVIQPDDLAVRFLDRDRYPEWHGKLSKMLYGFEQAEKPKNWALWETYLALRRDSLKAGNRGAEATAHYAANREAMDEGLSAGWPMRKSEDELSGIQHAINTYGRIGEAAFFAEYQNEPVRTETTKEALSADEIAAKANGLPRGIIPTQATKLVAMIDVQKEMLFFTVAALWEGFGGHISDYGAYPDQKREYFSKLDIRNTLKRAEKVSGLEQSIRKGLESLTALLLGREWLRQDGSRQRIERCLIDARFVTDVVKAFCRETTFASVVLPSFGMGINASALPLNARPKKPGEQRGYEWRIPAPEKGSQRHIVFDANAHKSFLMERFRQPAGGTGCFTIFGESREHRLYADHITGEYPVDTEGRGRKLTEWKLRPARPDVDFLDTTVGCCVAGSSLGIALAEMPGDKPDRVPRKIRMSEWQKKSTQKSGETPAWRR